jgi:hypothetical protein
MQEGVLQRFLTVHKTIKPRCRSPVEAIMKEDHHEKSKVKRVPGNSVRVHLLLDKSECLQCTN